MASKASRIWASFGLPVLWSLVNIRGASAFAFESSPADLDQCRNCRSDLPNPWSGKRLIGRPCAGGGQGCQTIRTALLRQKAKPRDWIAPAQSTGTGPARPATLRRIQPEVSPVHHRWRICEKVWPKRRRLPQAPGLCNELRSESYGVASQPASIGCVGKCCGYRTNAACAPSALPAPNRSPDLLCARCRAGGFVWGADTPCKWAR